MSIQQGSKVKVLAPFDGAFPDVYTVEFVMGSTAFLTYTPEGYANAFDVIYLVEVADD